MVCKHVQTLTKFSVYAKLTDGTGNETVYGDLLGLGPFLLVRECRAALLSRGSQA